MAPPRPFVVAFPTRDLAASERFASALGFAKRNASVGGTEVVVLTYSDAVSIIYHARVDFDTWLPTGTKTHLPDGPAPSAQSYVGLSFQSKAEVDAMVAKAVAAGGKDYGAMIPVGEQEKVGVYYRAVADPDGHLYSFTWMNPQVNELARAAAVGV